MPRAIRRRAWPRRGRPACPPARSRPPGLPARCPWWRRRRRSRRRASRGRQRPVLAEAQAHEQRDRGALRRDDPADAAEARGEDRQAHPVEQGRPQGGQPDRQVDELQQPDSGEVDAPRPQDQRRPARQEAERGPEGHVQAQERGERAPPARRKGRCGSRRHASPPGSPLPWEPAVLWNHTNSSLCTVACRLRGRVPVRKGGAGCGPSPVAGRCAPPARPSMNSRPRRRH